jgi:MYXO-CTERM domain-containing protein
VIDDRELFERAAERFDPPIDSLERLFVQRDRRRRNQRIATAVLALILAAAAIGGAIRVLGNAERQLPANRIDQTNVKNLDLAWSAKLDGADSSVRFRSLGYEAPYAPTVAGGKVYVGTDTGKLYAFDASCGSDGGPCQADWIGSTGKGIPSPPTVADGVVYVGAQDGRLYAFPTDCGTGGAACSPLWVGDTGGAVQSPVVADGIVYGFDVRSGTVFAFETTCGTGGATCEPLWTHRTDPTRAPNRFVVNDVPWRLAVSDGVVFAIAKGDHDGLYAFDALTGRLLWLHSEASDGGLSPFDTPIVEGGSVFANIGQQGLQAFPIGCRSDGNECPAAWTFSPSGFVAAADGFVYTNNWTSGTSGTVYALPVDCAEGGGICQPRWSAADDGWGEIVVGEGKVLASSINGDALDAFSASCSDPCDPAWTARSLGGPRWAPVVVNGVVYVGSADGSLHGFSISCGTDGSTCQPLWSRTIPGSVMSPPAIEGMTLFAVTLDGRLVGFSLPSMAGEPTASSSAPTHWIYLGLAALVGIALLASARRRRTI